MTATLEDRAAPEDEVRAPVEDVPSSPPPPRTLMLAEAALIGVSLATVIGYARLFADGAFLVPIALAAVVGHLVAIALRRVGLGPLLSTIAHLALLPLVLTWARYWETSARFLPTGLTIETVSDDLAEAWKIFLDISAPVPAAPGFIAVAMVTAWVVALASDSLAFRLDATVEALAPATGLFLFSSILAEREHRTTSALLFVVAVLVFVLAARVAHADGTGRWLATDAGRGARSLLAAGLLLAGLAVIPAVIAGPRLPGGDGRPLVDLDGGGGDNDRVTLSPLVDIRSRLVEQSTVEAFRVDAAAPSYWRITALDAFDGQIWSSSGNYVGVDGRLPSTPDPAPGAARLSQHFRIGALDQIWLPAAFEPVAVHSPDADVDWDGDSSSLVVGTGRETSDGLEYDVLSILPRLNPDDLSVGTAGLDTEFLARFTRLPETTGPIARALRGGSRRRGDRRLRTGPRAAELVPHPLPVQPRGPARPRHPGPRRASSTRSAADPATASSSPGPMPRWPAPSACRPGWPSASPRASRPRTSPAPTSCGAPMPTPGQRSTSPVSAGSPSSPRRAGAPPVRRRTPTWPRPRPTKARRWYPPRCRTR